MAWTLRFVTDTTDARTTRLDLNVGTAGDPAIELDDYNDVHIDFGEAGLERTLSDPEGRDGQIVTSSKRPNREVNVPLCIHGDAAEFAAAMGALSRECDRTSNLLEWCPDDTEPVFFVVHQGVISNPQMDNAAAGVWTCDLTLLCDPAALGQLVTTTITDVDNDPAAAAKAQGQTLGTILGDVPAPLNVVASGTTLETYGATTLISVHTHETAFGRVLRQAEAGTSLHSDTTVQSNSAVMSGAGSNYLRTTFSTTTTMFPRFQFANLDMDFGTYKLLARVRKSIPGAEFRLRYTLKSPSNGTETFGETKDYRETGTNEGPNWIDLGPFSVPFGGSAPAGVTSGVIGTVLIWAERLTVSGSLDFDCFVWVPTERPGAPKVHMSTTWFMWGGGSTAVFGWDADNDRVWNHSTSGYGFSESRQAGAMPLVYPGYTNRLVFMRHVGVIPGGGGPTVSADNITWTSDLEVSYHPRWLFVAEP